LWSILANLAAVETASGAPQAAEHWRQQARVEVNWLLGQSPPALRSTFLARPDVAEIMGPVTAWEAKS
jgi:hypothetical protein